MAEAHARSIANYLNNSTDRPYNSSNNEYNTSIQNIRGIIRETRTTCGIYRNKYKKFLRELDQLDATLEDQRRRNGIFVKMTDKILNSNVLKGYINDQMGATKSLLIEGIVLFERADRITAGVEALLEDLNERFPRDDALSEIIRVVQNMSEEPTSTDILALIGLENPSLSSKDSMTIVGTSLVVSVGAGVVVGTGLAAVLAVIFGGIGAIGSLGAAVVGGTVGAAIGACVGLGISKMILSIKSGKARKETYQDMLLSMVEFRSLIESSNQEVTSILEGVGDRIEQFQSPLEAILRSYQEYVEARENLRNSTDLQEEEIQQVLIIVSDCAQPIMDKFRIDKEHAWTIILYLNECA